jgi:hypothetical protein
MKELTLNAQTVVKTGLAIMSMAIALISSSANGAIICDGIPVPVTIAAGVANLSILSTTNGSLILTLPTAVGNQSQLTIAYSGTAHNGTDFELLPSTVTIPALKTSATLTVKPKASYPFTTKTLTATITSSANVCVSIGSPNVATITFSGFDAPKLQPTFINATNMLLEWLAPVSGYVLQSSSSLAPGTWLTVTNAANGLQGTNQAMVALTGSTDFYRLMKP